MWLGLTLQIITVIKFWRCRRLAGQLRSRILPPPVCDPRDTGSPEDSPGYSHFAPPPELVLRCPSVWSANVSPGIFWSCSPQGWVVLSCCLCQWSWNPCRTEVLFLSRSVRYQSSRLSLLSQPICRKNLYSEFPQQISKKSSLTFPWPR